MTQPGIETHSPRPIAEHPTHLANGLIKCLVNILLIAPKLIYNIPSKYSFGGRYAKIEITQVTHVFIISFLNIFVPAYLWEN